jgi:hypothetical protein
MYLPHDRHSVVDYNIYIIKLHHNGSIENIQQHNVIISKKILGMAAKEIRSRNLLYMRAVAE